MLYATRFRAPDAFAFVGTKERTAVLLSDLEVDRGRREAKVDDVVSYSELEKVVQGAKKKKKPAYAKVLARFLKSRDVRRVLTQADFPLGLARALKKENIRVQPADALFWPGREIKNAQEIEALGAALRIAEAGIGAGARHSKAGSNPKRRKAFVERESSDSGDLAEGNGNSRCAGGWRGPGRYDRCLRRTSLRPSR